MYKLLFSAAIFSLIATAQSSVAQDLQAGADLYNDNCGVCHGNKGQGYSKESVPEGAVRIKGLAGDAAYWDFAVFKKSVVDGIDDHGRQMRVMPVFAKTGLYEPAGQMLTDEDLKNIQAYMQTFGPKE